MDIITMTITGTESFCLFSSQNYSDGHFYKIFWLYILAATWKYTYIPVKQKQKETDVVQRTSLFSLQKYHSFV